MARSRKKTPITGVTMARSKKADKQTNHRRERRRVRQKLDVDAAPDVLPHTKELSDPWSMAKDGKIYLGRRTTSRDFRK
jgi:hypothetical protein